MQHARRLRPGLLLGLGLTSAPLAAAPGHAYGFGARATALAGAVSADSGDAASLFYNPALLSLAPRSQLLLGYRSVQPSLLTNHQPAAAPGLSGLEGAVLGRGQFFGVPVGFGLGLALSNGHLSRVSSLRADEPRWPLRETLPELFDLAAALALRPTPWLALGAGSGFLATAEGDFDVTGRAVFADGQGSEYDSQLRHAVDARLVTARFLLLGAELRLPRLWGATAAPVDWCVGLSFRDQAALTQALRGALAGNVDAGFVQLPVRYTFESRSLLGFQPRQLVLGLSALREGWRLNLDLGFEQWSRYPSPVARSGAHIEADVPPGLPLALPADTALPGASDAGFHDRFTYRAGLERRLPLSRSSELLLRAGYAYLPSPAPRTSDSAQLLDASEHVFALGGGISLQRISLRVPHGVQIDAHALYGHLPNRRLERNGDTFYAKGHVLSAGVTLTLSLSRRP
jgi:long-chain fatty acid transport protein